MINISNSNVKFINLSYDDSITINDSSNVEFIKSNLTDSISIDYSTVIINLSTIDFSKLIAANNSVVTLNATVDGV